MIHSIRKKVAFFGTPYSPLNINGSGLPTMGHHGHACTRPVGPVRDLTGHSGHAWSNPVRAPAGASIWVITMTSSKLERMKQNYTYIIHYQRWQKIYDRLAKTSWQGNHTVLLFHHFLNRIKLLLFQHEIHLILSFD